MSDATAADANAEVDGFTPRSYKAGEAVTLIGKGMKAKYSDGLLTPGQRLYVGTTAGLCSIDVVLNGLGDRVVLVHRRRCIAHPSSPYPRLPGQGQVDPMLIGPRCAAPSHPASCPAVADHGYRFAFGYGLPAARR